MIYDDMEDGYVPSEEEQKEIEEMLTREDQQHYNHRKFAAKNRLTFLFASPSHWSGWLKTNGIKWEE